MTKSSTFLSGFAAGFVAALLAAALVVALVDVWEVEERVLTTDIELKLQNITDTLQLARDLKQKYEERRRKEQEGAGKEGEADQVVASSLCLEFN